MAGCLLWLPLHTHADDIIRYRTPDGSIGFAQDASGVPPGATLIEAPRQAPRIQIQSETPTASPGRVPPKMTPEMLGMPTTPKVDPWGDVLRESQKQEAVQKGERNRAVRGVKDEERKLELLGQKKRNACAKVTVGWNGNKPIKERRDPAACNQLRAEQERAEADYEQQRADVDDQLNGDLDYELQQLDAND